MKQSRLQSLYANLLNDNQKPDLGQSHYRAPATPEGSSGTQKGGVIRSSQESVKYVSMRVAFHKFIY